MKAEPSEKIFREFLRGFWMDNTEEEAVQQWGEYVRLNPPGAKETLDCLDEIIAHPPANLIETMEEHGWIILSHEPDEFTVTPFTYEETLEWLRQMTERFRTVYESRVDAAGETPPEHAK